MEWVVGERIHHRDHLHVLGVHHPKIDFKFGASECISSGDGEGYM